MPSIDVRMGDRYGLHPRAALRIQQTIAGRRSTVTIQGRAGAGTSANAASLISLVSAGIEANEMIRVTAVGEDEDAVLAALRSLFEGGVCHP